MSAGPDVHASEHAQANPGSEPPALFLNYNPRGVRSTTTFTRKSFIDLAELAGALECETGTEKDGPHVTVFEFDGGRNAENIKGDCSILLLDIDGQPGTIDQLCAPLKPYDFITYTTFSHDKPDRIYRRGEDGKVWSKGKLVTDPNPDIEVFARDDELSAEQKQAWYDQNPSFRIVIPLAAPLSKGDYKPTWLALERMMKGILDSSTKDACRLMYLPRRGAVVAKRETGARLDPAKVRELYPEPQREQAKAKPKTKQRDAGASSSSATNVERIRNALEHIDPDEPYGVWCDIGMALHSEGAQLFEVWDSWSRGGTKYKEGECDELWGSFDANGGITIATLFHLAKGRGWDASTRARREAPADLDEVLAKILAELEDDPSAHLEPDNLDLAARLSEADRDRLKDELRDHSVTIDAWKRGVRERVKAREAKRAQARKAASANHPDVQGLPGWDLLCYRGGDSKELSEWWVKEHSEGKHAPINYEGGHFVPNAQTQMWDVVTESAIKLKLVRLSGVARYADEDEAGNEIPGAPITVTEPHAANTCKVILYEPDVEHFGANLGIGEHVVYVRDGAMVAERRELHHHVTGGIDVPFSDRWSVETWREGDTLLARYFNTTWDDVTDQRRAAEVLGVALLGLGTRCKKMWWLVDGEAVGDGGGTGKSTFIDLAEAVVPARRRCSIAPVELADERHRGDLAGKTLNTVRDTSDRDIFADAQLKAIAHGERQRANPKYESVFEFTPRALHVFAANTLPSAPGISGAFYDRWEFLEFAKRWRNTDEVIPDLAVHVVEHEMSDLVHLALCGARRVLEQGYRYTPSPANTRRLNEWRTNADPVSRWVAEETRPIELDVPKRAWPSATSLYEAFNRWCADEGHRRMSSKKFGERLVSAGVVKAQTSRSACYAIEVLSPAEREANERWHTW